ncbi:CMGC/SRPK protein kinase [Blastomyces dermatitidis ATCC 18188]|uniref:non-specific serine/threonine protein kinase n=1 Tax=Ajellomyces dermatitidis (strain ATCC 18188 / CBS 674.68) TaxID=653446 RepID=F2TIV3_AJEDA|nr:CMGC/SRPK protein kinase [Blastomyces dermatitidis ATCC 18188]EQL29628.1 CMGC/SRPK protein kinase [Blastomyces dermatitidis ATCC 26199]EQL29629.1 CMGC/SRPK protein kinase, variant 1 [Blastomyces dermatitidis ATCC 26199]
MPVACEFKMRRFERIHDVVEPVEEYRQGGYHPVHLHDIFNQRYEVIGKLAFGQFSTVWLTHDQLLQRHVALKILKADASRNNKELAMLLKLSALGLDHPGKGHVIELLDYFEHDGPNGTHLCLVLPAMISDGEITSVSGRPHHAAYVRAISKQVLLGLDFLHQLGIIHCDLQPANVMFSIVGAAHGEAFLQPPEFSPVRWLEGVKVDDSAPEYLMATQRRRGELDDADFTTILVKIGDLGGGMMHPLFISDPKLVQDSCHYLALWSRQRDQRPVTPTALRAPELIHRNTWDASIDIWALGCLIFELATNEPLFPLGSFGLTAEQIDKEHTYRISQLLDENGQMHENFTKHLTDRLPYDFGTENVQHLVSFLSLMLQQNPQRRMPITKLLNHPFLVGEPDG